MAEQDEGASEMEHAREVLQVILVARTVATIRCDHRHSGFSQFSIKLVGVVGIVTNQALDGFFRKDLCEGFMWPGAFRAVRDRQTMAVCKGMILVPFPRLV